MDTPQPPRALTATRRRTRLLGGGVAGNRALTSVFGIVLLVLLAAQVVSAVFFALLSYNVAAPPIFGVIQPLHFFVGFLLFPLIGLKLAAVGWRFTRYYTRNRDYHEAGAPSPVLRLIAPLLVLSAVVVFASGVEMWSFQNQFGLPWITLHDLSAFTFVTLLAAHVAYHYRHALRDSLADLRVSQDGAITRRALLGGGAVAGLTLAVGAAQWPSSMLSFLAPLRAGAAALDFPVMNYEGGAQRVDPAAWRLRIEGDVDHPIALGVDQLMALPMEEHRYAIDCVTGWNATRTWRGVPVMHLLRMAGIRDSASHVQVRSTSGYHWDHHRDHLAQDGALLVTHVDGVRLDDAHGFPLRLMLPGVTGQSNVKWVDGLTAGSGTPENYLAAHTQWGNQPVSGYFLRRDPAGMRR
jgi:DMSO/TMAO reductase YedYZ molybdopterin-dependent catalytic subunit